MAGLPFVQALADDAPSVTVAEASVELIAQDGALGSEPQPEMTSSTALGLVEVRKDRMVWASDSFRPPAPPRYELATEGRWIVRWPEFDHSYFY